MTKILLAGFLYLFICLEGRSQSLQTFKSYCGLYYKDMEGLLGQEQKELDFFKFQPGKFVASIGAQWDIRKPASRPEVEG